MLVSSLQAKRRRWDSNGAEDMRGSRGEEGRWKEGEREREEREWERRGTLERIQLTSPSYPSVAPFTLWPDAITRTYTPCLPVQYPLQKVLIEGRVGQREVQPGRWRREVRERGKNTIDYIKTSRYHVHSRLYVMGIISCNMHPLCIHSLMTSPTTLHFYKKKLI